MPDWNGNRQTNLICDTAGSLRSTAIANAAAAGGGGGGVIALTAI